METGPSTSHLCDVLVFLKLVSLCTTYPTGPMIFLTWIGRIIQCLPWICVLIVSCSPECGPMFCSVEGCWSVQEAAVVWVTMLQ